MTFVPDPNAKVLPAEARRILRPVPKQCWWNALAAAKWYEKRGHSVLYVEGFAVMREFGLAFEHGWLEVDGQTIETTTDTAQAAYFPAARYAPDFARRAERKAKHEMPLTGWPGMRDVRAWRSAMVKATAKSLGQPEDKVDAFLPKLPDPVPGPSV